MDKLKTNLERLKSLSTPGIIADVGFDDIVHDLFLAHTFQARIKEVLAMEPAEVAGPPSTRDWNGGSNFKLKIIKAILRGQGG